MLFFHIFATHSYFSIWIHKRRGTLLLLIIQLSPYAFSILHILRWIQMMINVLPHGLPTPVFCWIWMCFREGGPHSLCWGNAELKHWMCSLSTAFSGPLMYSWAMSIPGKAVVCIVPQTSFTWSPFLHRVSCKASVVLINNVEHADADAPPSLMSSLLTSASSLLWQKLTMWHE